MKVRLSNLKFSICSLLIMVISLLGCVNKEDKTANSKEPGLRFRLALEMKPETKIWDVSRLFKTELEKASPKFGIQEGEIKIDFYDQGSIGTERQLLEACSFGVVEVIQVNTAVLTNIEPTYAILNLPYLFNDEIHHQNVLNGAIGQEMLNMLEKHNVKGLGFYSTGFRSLFYKYPVDKPCAELPQDLKGLKIRVMESPTMISTINAMGPSASPLPFSELYQGIKTGVVDGAENSPKVFSSYRYEEAGCNCFTFTEHSTDQHILAVNNDWLNTIKPKYRKRILEVAKDIVAPYNEIWIEATNSALLEMNEHAVRVNQIKDKKPFIVSAEPVYKQFFELYPNVSKDLFNRIKNAE